MSRACRFEGCRGRTERELKRTGTQVSLSATPHAPVVRDGPLCLFSMGLRSLGTETVGCLKSQKDKASKSLFFSYVLVFLRGGTMDVWGESSFLGRTLLCRVEGLASLVSRHYLFVAPPQPPSIWRQPKTSSTIPSAPGMILALVKGLLPPWCLESHAQFSASFRSHTPQAHSARKTPPIPNTKLSPLLLASNQPCSKPYILPFLFCFAVFPNRLWLMRASGERMAPKNSLGFTFSESFRIKPMDGSWGQECAFPFGTSIDFFF